MASPRSTFTLAVLFVLFLGYLLFFERRFESTDERAESRRHVLHVHADQVVAMALKRDAWTSGAVERIDGATWKRTFPIAGAVDSAAVGELCSDLEFAEHRALLEGHGGDAERLCEEGLSPPALVVTLTLADRRELEFQLGKETPAADGVYLHVGDASEVQVVDKVLRDRFDALLDSLNDTSGAGAAEGAPKPDRTKGEAHGSE